MTAPAVVKSWSSLETLTASDLNTEFSNWVTYVGNRNDGTAAWDICNVTATAANPVKISGNQSITEVSINNTATDGDPILSFELGGTSQFTFGVDDGDSDVLKGGTTAIGTGTWLKVASGATDIQLFTSGNQAMQIDTNGTIFKPKQPSFLVTAPANTLNVTGDGTTADVEFDTEIYDLNDDFNTTTYTFSSPVTGKFQFNANVVLTGLLTANHSTVQVLIVTSNRNYGPFTTLAINGQDTVSVSCVADMDAADTAKVRVSVAGDSKVVEVGDNAVWNQFSGSLLN
jgi:hypothetical protein